MPNTRKSVGRGPRFDQFPEQPGSDRHGAQHDRFTSQPSHPHNGSFFDSNFGHKTGGEFEQALARVPESVRRLPAGCPQCGHQHDLEAALRAGRQTPAATKARDDAPDVQKQKQTHDDTTSGDGGLHDALVASIRKTYGADRAWSRG